MASMLAKIAPLFAMGLAVVPVAVQAETTKIAVKYQDLDLTRADHQAKLDTRIARAVTKVCGQTSARTLSLNGGIKACRDKAARVAQNGARVAIARAEQKRAFAANESPIVGN